MSSLPPPPGWEPQPPQPKRKLSTTQKVIIIVAAIVVLCCGGAAVGGYFIYRAVDNSTQPMRDAATGYLDNLKAHDYTTAYGRLCDRVRARITPAQFEAVVSAKPLADYEVTGFHVSNQNGLVDGTVTVSRKNTDGTKISHIIPMVKDGDAWRVCGDPD
jgi:hypothetical protein